MFCCCKKIVKENKEKLNEIINDVIKNNYKILVADDLETNREVLERMILLFYSDIIIDSCKNGYEVLNLMDENKYKIIFLDLKMPGCDGYKVLENLALKKYKGLIVIVSAYDCDETIKIFDKKLNYIFMRKPINLLSIKNLLEKYFI